MVRLSVSSITGETGAAEISVDGESMLVAFSPIRGTHWSLGLRQDFQFVLRVNLLYLFMQVAVGKRHHPACHTLHRAGKRTVGPSASGVAGTEPVSRRTGAGSVEREGTAFPCCKEQQPCT